MKRLLLLFLVAVAPCFATTRNISSGASCATIQSTIQGSSSGDQVVFAAGTYTINCFITIPNGVSMTGPTIARTSSGIGNPTAILNGNVGSNWAFLYSSGSAAATIQYLEWNGGQPQPDGGGFIRADYGVSNLTIHYNKVHGNQASLVNDNVFQDTLIWFDGITPNDGGVVDSNDTVEWNLFGGANDCSNVNGRFTYGQRSAPGCDSSHPTAFCYYDAIGGECAGIGVHTQTNNFTIANNTIAMQEQGIKLYEGGTTGGTDLDQFFIVNTNIRNNDICCWWRIAIEAQQTPNANVDMGGETYYGNSVHDQQSGAGFGSWGFSMPQWDWYTLNIARNTSLYGNLMVGNVPPASGQYLPGAFEWTSNNGQNFNNTLQGNWACDNQVNVNPNNQSGLTPSQATASNNVWQAFSGCFINNDYSVPGHGPGIQQNNQTSTSVRSYQSAAPTISPTPSGTYSGTVTVTLGDAGFANNGVGAQGNTTIYYTTDGSTPTVTSASYCNANTSPNSPTNSCSIGVPAGTTVKALGMWGSINQPKSYPTNYGFTPSGVVSAFYPSSGTTPSLTGISLSLAGNAVTVGGSAQVKATCSYNNSTTDDCTKLDPFGNVASGWVSSNTTAATIDTAGVLTARAAGSTNVTAAAGAFSSFPLTITINAAAPTLTGVSIADGGVGSLAMGQAVQATATALYSGGAIPTNCTGTADIYGTVCNTWTSSAPAIATISSSGLITGVAQGTAAMTVKATNAGTSFTSPQLNITVTSNTPPPATLTGVTVSFSGQTSVQAGNTIAGGATCAYSDGSTTNCGTTDAHGTLAGTWASSSTSVATINSTTGVATGVAVGFTNITVHAGAFTSPIFQLQVTPATTGAILGTNQTDFSGQNFHNAFVATYACAPTHQSIVSSLNLYLPAGTYPASTPYDVLIVPAPSSTTMASAAICSGTYTTNGTASDIGWHVISPIGTGCGIIPANSCYWVGDVTTGDGVGQGFYGCDAGSALCNGAPPTNGVGAYHFGYNSVTYGTYTNMPAPMTFSGAYQVSAYAALATPNPTLVGGFLGNQGSVNALLVGQTIQFVAFCTYSDGTTNQCFPTADQYGNTAAGFSSSNSGVIMITSGGLATAVGTGAANVTGTLTSSATAPWTITVSAPTASGSPASGGRKRPKK